MLAFAWPRAEMAALSGAKTVWLPCWSSERSWVGAAWVSAPARPVRPAPWRAARAPAAYWVEFWPEPPADWEAAAPELVAVAEPPEVAWEEAADETVAAAAVSEATEALKELGSWLEMVEAAAATALEIALLADSVAEAGRPEARVRESQ